MCNHQLIFFICGHYFHELLEQCRRHHDALREKGWPGWVGGIEVPMVEDMDRDALKVAYRQHTCAQCSQLQHGGKFLRTRFAACMDLLVLRT